MENVSVVRSQPITFCVQNGLVDDDVSEDTGLSSILWRIRLMPSEGVQKRRCVTSNVTAIRAPTYKERGRMQKKTLRRKIPQEKMDNLRFAPLRSFSFRHSRPFKSCRMILRDETALQFLI